MISHQEAKRLADEHLRAEGSPWVATSPTRNLRFGVWIVGYRDPAEPDVMLDGGGLVVTDDGDAYDLGSAPGLLDDLMISLGLWPGAEPADVGLPEDRRHPIWTAYHEAGHAVAYLAFGLAFTDVTIHSDTPTEHLGEVRREPAPTPGYINGLVAAAGPAAEAYLGALQYLLATGDGEEEDAAFTAGAVLYSSRDTDCELREAVSMLDNALDAAVDLVVARWPSITALAAALLDRTTLTYAECREIASG